MEVKSETDGGTSIWRPRRRPETEKEGPDDGATTKGEAGSKQKYTGTDRNGNKQVKCTNIVTYRR